jgi:nucleotide-binding universal stress UspA family protein
VGWRLKEASVERVQGRLIVVGVHGSPSSLAALRWAAREAALRGTGLLAVRAWEDQAKRRAPYASLAAQPVAGEDRVMAAARLEESARTAVTEAGGAAVSVRLAEGLAARVLLDHAAGAELLVLGSAAGEGPHAVGPVAQACLRHAPCPVVVVSGHLASVPVPA